MAYTGMGMDKACTAGRDTVPTGELGLVALSKEALQHARDLLAYIEVNIVRPENKPSSPEAPTPMLPPLAEIKSNLLMVMATIRECHELLGKEVIDKF